jgi:uncharacterized repeat protein (TIGR03837 family)
MPSMQWDLFCHVIDNFGDIGVCWRLAADLASRGEKVRLWVDDASALAWMAPTGAPGVEVRDWRAAQALPRPGEVVIEAFGCDPPAGFVSLMSRTTPAPLWINLEYLSAQDYVERSHGLPSPQLSGPGEGLVKWFYYPGFSERTGGLLRETGLMSDQAAFDADSWLASRGLLGRPGERRVSLFCYDNATLPALLHLLGQEPTLLLATAGAAGRQVQAALGPSLIQGKLRAITLPYLTQVDYDRLLWACDFNFVRGEDSFVRAQWAGKPFVWQAYPQRDAAHQAKLEAFLRRFLHKAGEGLAEPLRGLWRAWNEPSPLPTGLPEAQAWRRHCMAWRDDLLLQADLVQQLLGFVAERG